ncbi:MAG: TrkH family potassium uptake protein [Lachnospiraceae bacterium]|jgi:trk system potassium uptake protein TrkH
MNKKMLLYITGTILVLEAALMMVPALTGLFCSETVCWTFFMVAGICLAIGLPIRLHKPADTHFYAREGYVSTALSWIIMSLFGALPLWLSGFYNNYVDAFFEIVSGFTTTGATVLSDVEVLPKCIILWRSFSHWIGGMGVLVFMLAVLPVSGESSMHLMRAESPGPQVDKLVPKVRESASLLYKLYIALTVAETMLLVMFRLPVFSAVNIAFSTAGTGGFGFLNDSYGSFSPAVKIIIGVFMALFGVNFNVYFWLYTGNVRSALHCEEARVYFAIILACTVIIGIDILPMYSSAGGAFLDSFFQVSSIITTTGFSTTDFDLWPQLSKTILVTLMFIGACAGSTGGGLKVSRVIIMAKTIRKEISVILHPRTVKLVRFEGKTVGHDVIRAVNVFVMAYIFLFVFSLLIVSLDDYSFTTNFTAVACTLNNIGPGLEAVGPTQNFGGFSNLSKIVFSIDMLAGRLEIFPLLVLFSRSVWTKRQF